MRMPFRITILSILLGLVLLTVLLIGVDTYRNTHFTIDDLTAQILGQTTERIEAQIQILLERAESQSKLSGRLIESGQLDGDNFHALVRHWTEVMTVAPELTSIYVGLENEGDSVMVSRLKDPRLHVWEIRTAQDGGERLVREYWADEYAAGKLMEEPTASEYDARERPWYKQAVAARKSTWSQSYVFFGLKNRPDVIGLTYATPVYKDGAMEGVIGTDLDLLSLCKYFQQLNVGKSGYAFVVEHEAGAPPRIIAHPDPNGLLHDVMKDGTPTPEVMPMSQSPDKKAVALLPMLPEHLADVAMERAQVFRFQEGGTRYFGSTKRLDVAGAPHWIICTVMPEADVLANVQKGNNRTFLVSCMIVVTAIAVGVYFSAQVARPLEQLGRETSAIAHMDLSPRPVAHSIVLEVDRLALDVERMKAGLRSFQKYVPADIVRNTVLNQEATFGGERREVTILFTDIVDFTSIAEHMDPEKLVGHLRDYFTIISEEIAATGGTVDKFIGDAVMAFWGAPAPQANHALQACRAVLNCRTRLAALAETWRREGRPVLVTKFGLNSGEVVVGNFGGENRLNYTVIGDSVNLASRLEGLNKYCGTHLLMSESTEAMVHDEIVARPVDRVSVKGKELGVTVYELLCVRETARPEDLSRAESAREAFDAYLKRDWARAIELYASMLAACPGDKPMELLLARTQQYLATPPGADWDGIYRLTTK